MGGNYKFKVQDSFFGIFFFFEIWRSKKRTALSEKKPPLPSSCSLTQQGWDEVQMAIFAYFEYIKYAYVVGEGGPKKPTNVLT